MSSTVLEVRKVSYAYRVDGEPVQVLDGVDFEVRSGELVAIQGPSGSGKSTLLYILGCLLNPDRGTVQVCGQDLSRLSPDDRALLRNRTIGFVFQQFHLLPRATVLENILLPARYPCEIAAPSASDRERAASLARELGLEDRLEHLPNQLSGGQQQRVAIARAIMNDVKLILADEPTGNLDSRNAGQTLELLRDLSRRGKAVVIITHDAEVARQCSKIFHIRDGKITRIEEVMRAQGQERLPVSEGVAVDRAEPSSGMGLRSPDQYWRMGRVLAPLAWQNLRRNLGRSVLTMLGITIGISAVLAMVTLGQFTKKRMLESYEELGVNKLTIGGYRNWELQATDAVPVMFRSFSWERDLEPLRVVFPKIRLISPIQDSWNDTVNYGGISLPSVRTFGVNHEFLEINNLKIAVGRNLTPYHVENRSGVCVIGADIATRLFRGVSPIGQIVYITGGDDKAHTCQVIGVLQPVQTNDEWRKPNVAILMPHTYFQFVNSPRDARIHNAVIQVAQDGDVEKHSKSIKAYFERKYGKSGKFWVDSDAVLLAQMKKFLNLFAVMLGSIAMLSLAVGGIGITNMMLVSVSERIKEIGLRKALGATDFSVRLQFLLESVLLCSVAGLAGVLLGFAAYETLIFGASKFVSKLKFEWVIEPGAVALSAASILAVGLASGLIPALRAEKLQVIEALRNE